MSCACHLCIPHGQVAGRVASPRKAGQARRGVRRDRGDVHKGAARRRAPCQLREGGEQGQGAEGRAEASFSDTSRSGHILRVHKVACATSHSQLDEGASI